MQESIFRSAIRAFFITVFVMIGLCVGLIPFIMMLGSFGSTTIAEEPERSYKPQVVANADNVRKILHSTTPVILKLNIDGVIGIDGLTMQSVRQQLIESREGDLKDNRVKALLLYINSPGGTAVDADGIYQAIKAYKKQYSVPVYAYVDGLCASGGMYVAAAADKVYASNISLVGSVGVVTPPFLNFSQLIDKIGVQAMTFTAGKDKDIMNPLRPWKPEEEKLVQSLIDFYYQDFVNVIVENRPVNKEKLVNEYGAKVFNPHEAQEYGFINATDITYNQTLKELTHAAGITDDNYQVMEFKKTSWFSELFGLTEFGLLSGKVTHRFQFSQELDPALMNKFLYLYLPR